ncbi:ADP-forming succinate--CoA ligase subunit beta [Microvenator marinus]|jgi:succinyl-CoA synthetase beta subunit|uniref:Succinate--CoA ligase [ADP-forming] subunit beta n=1 Tax=Microvenator marinus TaxID=2600177 RepID=A0A5B8XLX9_9DELT|nr:ADP-forming succinate--CoA ligase subunit beta [Microvenator marinus]QED25978.1 ADP-forming succinate--CoA ligase subunit beta [Microvenator marinus]
MNIHEYQGKALFRSYGLNVPEGIPAFSVDEAVEAAKKLGGPLWVVKAQIHAGGRGKAGGVKLAKSLDEVREHANAILGATLVTHQTGPEGQLVRRLYIESGCDIAKEFYLGMVVDRATGGIVVMASTEGGVEIERVAEETPEKIHYESVNPLTGFSDFQGRKLAFKLGLEGKSVHHAVKLMKDLYKVFVEKDCSLVEINPLVLTKGGEVIALDAKLNFDDNALFRHPDIEELRDEQEEDASENEAKNHQLSYVKLDGNIGCMVNGAGLAMGTMDIIKHYGGEPANFLDVGGSADAARVAAAFKIITSDPNVKGIFINIFGGIMKCDVLADGVVQAAKEVGLSVPLVVRLEGTNVEKGRQILAESGLTILNAESMGDGAKKIIEAVN